jgi:predicted RNase H-like nuclease (RuvC/YqgF family)
LVSPLGLSSKIEIHYSNTYQNELYSDRIASQKAELKEYERMIIMFNIKNTQLAVDLKVLRSPKKKNEYLDEKIQALRSEGVVMRDLFDTKASAQDSRILELETEVALYKDRIAEVEGETQQQAQLYHWEAEQHKVSLKTLEALQIQEKSKAIYVAKLEESSEERMNLEKILETD